jgi:hypothetical protein
MRDVQAYVTDLQRWLTRIQSRGGSCRTESTVHTPLIDDCVPLNPRGDRGQQILDMHINTCSYKHISDILHIAEGLRSG